MALADWLTLFDQELKDTANLLAPAEKLKAVTEAIKEYSKHRPRERVHEITGTGSAFEFAVPTDWEDGFSTLRGEVEYPAGKREPEFIEREDWLVYRDPTQGLRFRLIRHTPTASEKVRFLYTVRHAVDATQDTVAVFDRESAAKLAASFGARALAAYYAQTQDPTLAADAVNYRTKAQDYTMLADRLLKAFKEHLGLKDQDQVPAAGASIDLDVDLQPGGDRFYHPRRWR
jgi:hypothetical protein